MGRSMDVVASNRIPELVALLRTRLPVKTSMLGCPQQLSTWRQKACQQESSLSLHIPFSSDDWARVRSVSNQEQGAPKGAP